MLAKFEFVDHLALIACFISLQEVGGGRKYLINTCLPFNGTPTLFSYSICNRTLIFEKYVDRCGSKNKPKNNLCLSSLNNIQHK
jgi:hypothetical protein